MITRSLRTSRLTVRRHYLTLPLLFVPNEEIHRFEGELLTNEENEALIPDRPQLQQSQKYHHNIISPEDVADLITRPNINDTLITVLSQDSTFLGSSSHKLVNIDPSKATEPAKLRFANIGLRWISLFNKQVRTLSELPSSSETFSFSFQKKLVNDIISSKYAEVLSEPDFYLYTNENLKSFYDSFKAFTNSERRLHGLLAPSELAHTVFFENVTLFLIGTTEVRESSANFEVLISFLEQNASFCTSQNLQEILVHLIHNLYESKLPSIQSKLASFNEFFDSQESLVEQSKFFGLEPGTLDKLAFLMSVSGNIDKANKILSFLIEKHGICPSQDTINIFLSNYQKSNRSTLGREKFLRELSFLKPALCHRSLSSIEFSVLLEYTVNDIQDLHQFINLVTSNKNGTKLLSKYQLDLLKKLQDIQKASQFTNTEKALQYTQLVVRLVESQVKLSSQAVELVEAENYKLGMKHNNGEAIRSLQ